MQYPFPFVYPLILIAMPITLNHLSYEHPDRTPLLHDISLSVAPGQKIALIGDNGSGKSTLLRIVAGFLSPRSGSVTRPDRTCYVPQHFGRHDRLTVAGALGIEERLRALRAILGGDASPEQFARLADDWSVEERALAALGAWNVAHIGLDRPLSSLSGGEKTKVLLAGIGLDEPEAILLDEPSNHLDRAARERLYDLVRSSTASMIVVSHDRTLLNLLPETAELTPSGIVRYGGNYEFYKSSKEEKLDAVRRHLAGQDRALREAQRTAREAAERKQRQDGRGERKQKGEGAPRIMLNTVRNRAESSASRLDRIHGRKIEAIGKQRGQLRAELPPEQALKIRFGDADPVSGRMLVEADGLLFGYGGASLWSDPLSLRIRSGERIVIRGANGSGKTTLLKLLLGQLVPTEGTLHRAAFSHLYVDQEYACIDDELTVLGQALRFNVRDLPPHRVKTELHRFLFPAGEWDKPCSRLSGGEKMRLIFCCVMLSDDTPDLFVLDEPTNNLDIRSLEIVASALKAYRGTLLVISHDDYFVREIGIVREIVLPPPSRR